MSQSNIENTQKISFKEIALEQIKKLDDINSSQANFLACEMRHYAKVFDTWESDYLSYEERSNILSDFISKATEAMKLSVDVSQKRLESNRPARS